MSYNLAPSREELIATLTEQRERLKKWSASRSPAELARPFTSNEPENAGTWRTQDHLAHMLEVEAHLQETAQRTLAEGDDSTGFSIQGDALGQLNRESVMRAINQAIEETFAESREEPVEGLLERLGKTRGATLELLASLSDEQLDRAAPHAPWGQGTVRDVFQQIAWHGERHIDRLTEGRA